MTYDFASMCPIFKNDYKHKIKLFGAFVYDTFSTNGMGRYVDLYMKSHETYFVLKTDIVRRPGIDDSLSIRAMSYDEFGYSRLCKNVIKTGDNGAVTFPELKYFSFKRNTEIIFNTIELDDNKKIKLISNITDFSFLCGMAHSSIDLTDTIVCTRDELIDLNFYGKEKDDIMKILIDNDKYQKRCFEKQLKERR